MKTNRLAALLALGVVIAALLLFWPEDRAPETDVGAAEALSGAYDLGRDEARGGHTLARHVGRSEADLRQRLEAEPGISAASSFTDRATAERVVGATVARERQRISRWLTRGGGNLALDYRGAPGETIGITLPRNGASARPTGEARVVLARSGDSFRVVTAYPLEPR